MNKYFKILCIILFVIFCFVFTAHYIQLQTPLYICDKSGYNLSYYDYGELIRNCNFSQFFSDFLWQVKYVNRNPFPVIFLIPFYFIFNVSRFGFVFAVEIIFMLPVMLLLTKLVKDNICSSKSLLLWSAIISAIFLCPAFWVCSLNGILDICGMIPVLIAWMVYLKTDLKSKFNWKSVLLISFLLYLSFLFRRWYSVVIFCFILSVLFDTFILCIAAKENIKQILKKFAYTILNICCISILIAIFGLLIQTEYVRNIIASEGAERVLYSFGLDLISQLRIVFIDKIGLFYFFLMLAGSIFFIKNRFILFVISNLILYLFAFFIIMNSQFLWINHYLFPACAIVILFIAGFYKLYDIIKNEKLKNIFAIVIILFNITNFCTYFYLPRPDYIQWFLPKEQELSRINANYSKILAIYKYLENEYNKNNDIKVAIYGLNDNIGWYQLRMLSNNSSFVKNNIFTETILDSDYNFKELLADYAIVISPPLNWLEDESLCRMLYKTHFLFMNNEGIAHNFSLVEKYNLDDGTSVFLYKKEVPLTIEQMKNYASYFYEFYPEWEDKFEQFLLENN